MNFIFVGIGSISLLLGVLGIFLPLLPTTPFLLLTAACYARGNKKFYHWLINHRWFGDYIKHFRSDEGIPTNIKIRVISILWLSIAVSAYFLRTHILAISILFVCAISITIFLILFKRKKHR